MPNMFVEALAELVKKHLDMDGADPALIAAALRTEADDVEANYPSD